MFHRNRAAAVAASALAAVAWAGAVAPASARETKADVLARTREMVAASGVACTLVDAERVQPERPMGRGGGRRGGGGWSSGGDERTRPAFYEAACQEGLGFIFVVPPEKPAKDASATPAAAQTPAQAAAQAPDYMNCLEAKEAADKDNVNLRCALAPKDDPRPVLQAIAARAGLDCAVKAVRGLGHVGEHSFFEVACRAEPAQAGVGPEGDGFILIADKTLHSDKPSTALSCFDTQENPRFRCELTHVGAVVAALHRFIGKAAPGCVPAKERIAGLSKANEQVFEVRCRNGDGYLARRTGEHAFDGLIACTDKAAGDACHLKADPPKA
jgi:pyruvate/2-oxoglutarate dehydrogenase complex dihydrolipoamide acyltransferase (E2) component